MAEPDHTFILEPGQNKRVNAGPYDREQRRPQYEIEVVVPSHVRNQIEMNQFLIQTGEGYLWCWDVKNKSSWIAFFKVTADGQLIRE